MSHAVSKLLTLGLTLALSLSLIACNRSPGAVGAASGPAAATQAAAELSTDDVTTAQQGDLNRSIALTGNLQALRQTTITAQIDGLIASVAVRPGASVTAGQELARFDPSDLEKQMAVSQSQLAKSREQLALNHKLNERNANLLKQNFISQNAFDSSDSQLRTAEADAHTSEAQLALAKQSLAKTSIRAPFAGTVAERLAEPGQRVGMNSKLFTLVDLSELEWVGEVPSGRIGDVKVGQKAEFRVDGFDHPFTGQVSRINPSVNASSKTVQIYLQVPNPDGALRDGLFAQGNLLLDIRHAVINVPKQAVRDENGKRYVLAIEQGKLVRRDVSIGAEDAVADRVEIAQGIDAGTIILVSGVRLTSGMAVKLPASAVTARK
ncbi:efflux RND transporter periplasmic adaptor subunit [Andreprevotia chitinilytica]|uniref:efflux RND transporter periplasmic adaptor subunit n=1 Tax=Andreprevotia chitinilytica TaxID=396808 RepID=UPI000557DE34|nr:efflux RND transporter periplasmic adaptor subunit [Andreprevotia chitinilytica]